MNRAPNVHDDWWPAHERQCGGKFVKIKEPDGYEKKLDKKDVKPKKEKQAPKLLKGRESAKKEVEEKSTDSNLKKRVCCLLGVFLVLMS
jgi:hypothetical protein